MLIKPVPEASTEGIAQWVEVENITELNQAITNQEKFIYLRAGTYILTQNLALTSGSKLFGEPGTIIDVKDYYFLSSSTIVVQSTTTASGNKGDWFMTLASVNDVQVGDIFRFSNISVPGTYQITYISGSTYYVDRPLARDLVAEPINPVGRDVINNIHIKNIKFIDSLGTNPTPAVYIFAGINNKVEGCDFGDGIYSCVQYELGIGNTVINCTVDNFREDSFLFRENSDGYIYNVRPKNETQVNVNLSILARLSYNTTVEKCYTSVIDIRESYRGVIRNTLVHDTGNIDAADSRELLIDNTEVLFTGTYSFDLVDSIDCKIVNSLAPDSTNLYLLTGATGYDLEVNGIRNRDGVTEAYVSTVTELEDALAAQVNNIHIADGTYIFTQAHEVYNNMNLMGESKEGVIIQDNGFNLFESTKSPSSTSETFSGNEGDYFITYTGTNLDSVLVGDIIKFFANGVTNNPQWTFEVTAKDTTAKKLYLNVPVPVTFSSTTANFKYATPYTNITFENLTLDCLTGNGVGTVIGGYYKNATFKKLRLQCDEGSELLAPHTSVRINIDDVEAASYEVDMGGVYMSNNCDVSVKNFRQYVEDETAVNPAAIYVAFVDSIYINAREIQCNSFATDNALYSEFADIMVAESDQIFNAIRGHHNIFRNIVIMSDEEFNLTDQKDCLVENCYTKSTTTGFNITGCDNIKIINSFAESASTPLSISTTINYDTEVNGERRVGDGAGNVIWRSPNGYQWRTIFKSSLELEKQGTNDPGLVKFKDDGAGSTGVFLYDFDATAEEELLFVFKLPPDYAEGTDFKIFVCWSPSAVASGDVVWGTEHTVVDTAGIFGNTSINTAADTSDSSADAHQDVNIVTITGTGLEIGASIVGRIFRDATNSGDSYTSDASLVGIGLRYQSNSHGSENETTK